jgi:hypothetical protein
MRASSLDLEGAVKKVIQDIHTNIEEFNQIALVAQILVGLKEETGAVEQIDKLIGAYQAIVTTVLHFSIQSPRYGVLKDRQEDGSFVVDL